MPQQSHRISPMSGDELDSSFHAFGFVSLDSSADLTDLEGGNKASSIPQLNIEPGVVNAGEGSTDNYLGGHGENPIIVRRKRALSLIKVSQDDHVLGSSTHSFK